MSELTDSISAIAHTATGASAVRSSHVASAVQLNREVCAQAMTHAQVGLTHARALGLEAQQATALLASGIGAGKPIDVEGLLLATRKADAAFQMLQAVRNAMVEAYTRAQSTQV